MADLAILGTHHSLALRLVQRVVLEIAGPVAQYAPKLLHRITRHRFEVHFEVEGSDVRRFRIRSGDSIVLGAFDGY